MDDEELLSTLDALDADENKADLRLQTGAGEFRGRSSYYDGDERLIIVDYQIVEPEEVPEEQRSDRTEDDPRTGFDAYLREEETYYRVEEIMKDPLIGESPGWEVEESSEPVATYIPVEGRTVVRQAGDMVLPEFVLYSHYNLRDDVFEDGGVWDAVMSEDPDDEGDV